MHYNTSARMQLLQQVQRQEHIKHSWLNDFLMLELLDDHLVSRTPHTNDLNLTYLGLRTLEEWDPVLGVVVHYHLLLPSQGDA